MSLDEIAANRKKTSGGRGRGFRRGRRGMRNGMSRSRYSYGRGKPMRGSRSVRRPLSGRRDLRKRIRISNLLPLVNNEDLRVRIKNNNKNREYLQNMELLFVVVFIMTKWELPREQLMLNMPIMKRQKKPSKN